jgi:hypothetical protein
LKVTNPAVVPKPVPLIVTCVPGCPWVGLILVIVGEKLTFSVTAGEDPIELVTTTGSAPVATLGTVKLMAVFFQERIVADFPDTVTVPVLVPKFKPTAVSVCPIATFCGLMFVIVGVKLKVTPLLWPLTTTGPEPATPFGAFTTIWVPVVLQETICADAPLNTTVPGADPNPEPVIVTCVPGWPDVGLMDVITGAAHAKGASKTHSRM